MKYTTDYQSPLGKMLLAADNKGLTGLWFYGSRYFAAGLKREHKECEASIFIQVKAWLDMYFSGKQPDFLPQLYMRGTDFQMQVWNEMLKIPYGKTMTYADIARNIGRSSGTAQAVGNAVGKNPISIIVPCHRVIGTNGSLTGYAAGIDKKIKLLCIEKANINLEG